MDKSLPSISATPAANSQSKKRSAIVRPRPLPLALEARLMFDGAAVAATVETMAAEPPSDTTQASDIVVPEALPTQPTRNEIAFVDTSVSNWSAMVASLGNTVEVVALDGTTDGLSQIANSLQGRSGLDAIHIISHGSAGNLQLSGVDYTAESIGRSYSRLQEIGQALAANGDILLYGCDIGQGSAGQALIDAIASITAADVAASSDATGAATAGGDWNLEAASGPVEASSLSFSDEVNPGLLGTPSVTSVDDRSYSEGQGAVIVDSNITVTGGGSYDGKYVRFSLTNGQTTDVLTLTNAANVNASGAISFSGTSVYLGNGSGRDIIGSIDATEDGTAGKALKINFVSSFSNASFESGDFTGWTALNQVINLGTTSIAGYTSPNDGTYPSNAGNDDAYPSSAGSYTTSVDSTQATDGSKSLRLLSSGITTASGYDVVHGPAVYSDAFSAVAGDKIYFDWRAYAGDDAYDVFGYILNTATGATTTVLDATGNSSGGSTSWATANVTIPTTGSYRFVFVSGTYDYSGGQAAGASLYIDNVRVYGSKVNDAVVTSIARQVAFNATSDNPVTASTRIFTVTAMSSDGATGSDTGLITVSATNDAPVLGGAAQTISYTENGVAKAIDTAITVSDPDQPANFNGGWLQVQITGNGTAADQLTVLNQGSGAGQIGVSGSNVTFAGTLIGTIDAGNTGANNTALRINLNSSASPAAVQALARAIAFSNNSDTPSTSARTVTFTLNDGGNTGSGGALQATRTATVNVSAVDDASVVTLGRTSGGYTENQSDFIIDNALTLADVDNPTLSSATVSITGNFRSAEDRLLPSSGTVNGITYSYNTGTGVLTLSGSATLAAYQDALRSIKYENISENPNTATRTLSIVAGTSVAKTLTVSIARTNDAPVNNAPLVIPAITEDAISNAGSLISSFLGATDADGNALGVAVTSVDNSNGTWQYSTDGGATWIAFGTPSDSAARLLRDSDKIRFVPNADFAGTATIAYRAWDRTTGTVGSTADLSNPNSVGAFKAVTNGDETAYSATKQTATLTVTAVNDAPVLTPASPALTGITEDDTSNAGQTVASLLGTSVSDVDASALEGIAITALTSGNGTWQYDTGSGWTNIGTVSASSALLLRATDSLRFVPDGKNATTGTVSFKAWDQTSGSAGSKVSTATSGGTSAFSTASDTASISVSAVNDAPVLGTPANLTSISEDATNNAGQTIASFLGSSLTDSDNGALKGIAITGTSNGGATGAWQYSTDSGSTWHAVGTPDASTALLLKSTDLIRFNPDGFQGGSPTLTLRGWDQSSGTASNGATRGTANVSTNGGTTAFSSAEKTVSLSVSELNDAPRFDTAASASSFTENSGTPATVGANLVLVDDGGNLSKATVSISAGFTAGDTLAVGTPGGLTVNYNSATGVLTLSGTASAATYQAALRSVTFTTASEDPTVNGAIRTLTWKATDTSGLVSSASTSTLTITPEADAPVLAGTAALAYTEDDGARVLAPLLTLSDVDDTQMAGAVVLLTGTGLDKAVEYLSLRGAIPALNGGAYEWSATNVMGYTGVNATYVWDSANSRGVLTIKGLASTAAYQQILRSVSYTSLGNYTTDPDTFQTVGTRSVDWRVIDANSDGAGSDPVATFLGSGTDNGTLSNLLTQTITITNANEAPQVSGANISLPYSEGDTIKILANAIVPSDDNSDNVLGSAQVQITAGLTEGDILAVGADTDASDGYTHTVNGTTVELSWNSVTASRSTTGDGSNAEVQTLRNLPKFATSQSFTLVVDSVTLSGTLAGPTLDDLVTALQADADYAGAPFTVARSGADLVIAWKAPGVVNSPATLTSTSTLSESITASYNSNGILSLSGNASIAAYQSVLRSVTYGNTTNDDPTATANTRAVQWRVFDANGTPSAVDANATTTIQVTAVNDAPTVAPSGTSATFSEGDDPVVAFAGLTLADPDDTLLTRATVEITGGGFTGDQLGIAGSVLTAAGLTLDGGSTASKLIITGTASLANYQAVLRQVTFSSSSDNPANSGSNSSRTLTWTVEDAFASRLTDYPNTNDWDAGTTGSVTSTITIAPTNDAPVLSGLPGSAASYTEGGSAITLASGITLADIDDANLTQAKVWISGGFTAGDTLSANAGSTGITVSYASATGILTLSHAGASKADFESVLRTVAFSSTADDPTAISPSRSISWQVTDADSSTGAANKLVSNLGTTQIDLTASDDGATLSGLASAAFTENGSPVAIAPAATLADSDDTTLSGLTVTISSGLTSGDLLSVGANLTGTGITVTAFDTGTGQLVLSGTASLADYTKALNSIVFTSSSENPTATSSSRTFTWSTTSSFASRTSDADAGNNGASGTVTASAGSNTLTITARNDAPSLTLGYNTVLNGSAVVFEQGGSPIYVLDSSNPNTIGSATLSDIDDSNMASASVVISGNRATDNTDTLSVATPAGWTRSGNTLTAPGGGTVNVAFDASTGTLTLTTASGSVSKAEYETLLEHVQYQNSSLSPTASGASRELTWTVTDANAAGDGAGSATGKSYMVIRDKNDAPIIAPTTDTVTYTEGDPTVALPDIVVTDVDPDEIVTATLTLSNVAAGALSVPSGASYNPATGVWTISGSVADVNTALAALTFAPATNNDQNATISISVADGGEDAATVASGTINLNVTAVNDAPVLTASHPVLAQLTEDATSNGGVQVSAFRGAISDVDSSFAPGIAITAQDAGNGKWQYQLGGNSGAWTDFGTVSDASALVLTDNDYIRFLPNAENATAATLSYRAWDGSGVVISQRMDATASGGSTPFSTVTDQASVTVTGVNDAPVLAAGTSTLPSMTEDDINNAGQTVASFLGANSTDVDSGALSGIAVTGLDSGNGRWQFRLDGYSDWQDAGAVSSTNALLLGASDYIRFVPNGLNATTGSIDYRAWDQTSGTAGAKSDASSNGGTSAFSTVQRTASLTVVDAVNDAPILTPVSPTLDTITEDENNNAGQTVASFLGSSISDVDNSALQGIAITDTTVGNGHWEYSIDANIWIAFPSISESTALLLRDTDRIRFVPDRMNGTTATLTYRAWDRTTVAGAGSRTDAGTNGGTTAFSALTDTATLTVTPVNDAPINDTLPTRIGAERANGTLRQIATAGSTAGVWRDVDIGDPATRITYQWQIADDASGNGLRDISGATASTYVISPDFVGKFLRLKVMGSDNDSTTNVYTGFTEITNIDPSATMALVDQKTTESVPITFTVPTAAFSDPDVSKGEDSFTYSAKLADGSPLPAWLTFDPLTLTFSGTPSGADVGVLAVSVFASDGGNFPASITFNLTVLSLPSNPQPASPLPPAELPPSNAAGIFLVPAPTIPGTTAGTVTDGGSGAASGSIGSPTLYAGTATSIDAGVGQPGGFNLGGGTGGFGLPSSSDSGAGGSPFAMPGMERNSGMAASGGDNLPKGILTAPGDGAFRVVVTQSDQPSLMVYRGISDASVQREGGTVQLQIPADAFTHTNPMAVITLSARLSNGAPLPTWLKFDQASGKLFGTPPADFSGVVEIEVTARDDDGREARVIFKIKWASRIQLGHLGLSEQIRLASRPASSFDLGKATGLAQRLREPTRITT